jgi:ERF superfamily.
MSIQEKLLNIQLELKAPKSQYNAFGKYNYRNCEDILEAVKPLCKKHKAVLTLSDEMILVGGRYYVKATAIIQDLETNDILLTTACAREEESKKGMDGSQVTGASSSYARKYALNGLFDIDDTKDSDATNKGETVAKEYKCVDCGKPFEAFTDKNGKTWNAGQVYHMAESSNKDHKARCKDCRIKIEKAGTQ